MKDYLAVGTALGRGIQEDTAVFNRSVHVGDHGTHVPGSIWLSIRGVFLRAYIFLDGGVPGSLVAFVNTINNNTAYVISVGRRVEMQMYGKVNNCFFLRREKNMHS